MCGFIFSLSAFPINSDAAKSVEGFLVVVIIFFLSFFPLFFLLYLLVSSFLANFTIGRAKSPSVFKRIMRPLVFLPFMVRLPSPARQ